MKRSLFTKRLKQTLLAVPACALMLGAAHAASTIGLNFQTWYYDSGNNPQTIGFMGTGYSAYGATGFPVTAKAFGVSPANWFNTDPMLGNASTPITEAAKFGGASTNFAGSLSCYVNSPKGGFQSGSGCKLDSGLSSWPSYAPGVFCPQGEDELLWGIIVGNDANPFSVSISGLAAKFPSGYVIQTLSAHGGYSTVNSLPSVEFTDGTTINTAVYHTWVINNSSSAQWPTTTAGISDPSGVFTADTIQINSGSDATNILASLAGVIITDQPVITQSAPATTVTTPGASFVLTSAAIGIGTLSYHWQHAGTNLTGANATFANYTNSSAATTDSGAYQVLVTSSSFPSITATGTVLTVAVHAAVTTTWDANTGSTGAQDGSGTWSLAGTNWWTGLANDVFYPNDSGIFGAGGTGAYTVTLADSVTASALTFNSGAYTITNSSGQTLTLSGSPAITATTNGTITVPVSVGNVLVKAGTGKVTLSGSLTSTNIFVAAGTLEVLAKNGDAPYVVTNGATLKIGYSTGGGYANTGMKIYGDGASATTGFYLAGGQSYNSSGQIQLLGAPTTIRQYGTGLASIGTFDVNYNGLWCNAAASGSAINANVQMISRGYGMSAQVDAGANTATGDLTINGPLNVSGGNSYGFFKRGGGSVRLNAAAAAGNYALQILGGTAICGATDCIGANAILNVSAGATLNLNGFNQTVANATATGLAGNIQMTIYTGGTPSATVLTTTDPGTALTYGGTLTVTSIGTAPTIGQTFTLFNAAGGYGGAFTTFNLPPFAGLAWDTSQLTVNGSITVIAGSVPPSIVTDLSGGTNYVYVGGSPTFAITASGDPVLHYKWLKNGTTPVGTDSPTLALTSVTLGDAGTYSCTVTNPYAPAAHSLTNRLIVLTPGVNAAAIMQDGPLAYWPLDETSGTIASDYAGAHDGVYQGSPTLGDAGATAYTGTAVGFDGASQNTLIGNPAALNFTGQLTIEAWVKPTATSGYHAIIEHGFTSTPNGEVGLRINSGVYEFLSWDGANHITSFTMPAGDVGNWVHLAGTYDGIAWTLYRNGVQVARTTNSTGSVLVNGDWAIGSCGNVSSPRYFAGDIDDVALYNYALSPTRIAKHAIAAVVGTAPLQVSLTPGGYVEDSKPAGTLHHAANYGCTWVASVTDTAGTPVTRNGVEQFASTQIVIPTNSDFNSSVGTICFWMRTPTTPANGNGTMLVDRRIGGGGTQGMVILVDGSGTGGIGVQYYGGPSFSGGGYVVDGNWHHVALVYDQSATGTVSVYVDGNLTGSQANTGGWSWPATQEIELGRSWDTYWQKYNGQMDDFRIYNRMLSDTEIGTIVSGDALVDTAALKVRYNFGTAAGVGTSLTWPLGTLESTLTLSSPSWSPVLFPTNSWRPAGGATSPYPLMLPSTRPTNAAAFYQLKL